MKVAEFREMSNEELNEKIYLLKEEVHRVRKDIARAYMVQRERELGIK